MVKAAVRSLACLPLFWAHLWAQGLDVMFVLETSPGTEQQIGLIRPRDLMEGDLAGRALGRMVADRVWERAARFCKPD